MTGIDKQRRIGRTTTEAAPKLAVGATNAMLQAVKLTAQVGELVAVACAVQGALDDLVAHTHALAPIGHTFHIDYFRATPTATALCIASAAGMRTASASPGPLGALPAVAPLADFDAAERHLGVLMSLRLVLRGAVGRLGEHIHPLEAAAFTRPDAQGRFVRYITGSELPRCAPTTAPQVVDPAVLFAAARVPVPPPAGALADRVAQAEGLLADLAGDFARFRQAALAYRGHTHSTSIGFTTFLNLPATALLLDGEGPTTCGPP